MALSAEFISASLADLYGNIINASNIHDWCVGQDVTYQTVPRALKDYNGNVVTNLAKDVTLTDKVIEVVDASSITKDTRLDIDGEQLYVTSKSGNKIHVRRGEDATTIASHLLGGEVKTITVEDNVFIDDGDDFGFDGSFI